MDQIFQFFRKANRMFKGVFALTIQSYTEVNSKRGVQYELSVRTDLGTSSSTYFIIEVGNKPVAVKDIIIQFDSEEISSTLFVDPEYIGPGTLIDIYNLRDKQAVPVQTIIRAGITPSNLGDQVGPEIHSLGSDGIGSSSVSSIGRGIGAERILESNTVYCLRVTNKDMAVSTRISSIATFYQGDLDHPVIGED